MEDKRFIFFMDDCGTRTICKATEQPDPSRLSDFNFALGGIIVPAENVQYISDSVLAFCDRWNVYELHGHKIRSKKGKFVFLKDCEQAVFDNFFSELDKLLMDAQVIAHACVICRPGYRDRYSNRYSDLTRWEMSKTAFDISIERAAKYAHFNNRKLTVTYERTGKKEDRLIEGYFHKLKNDGTQFNSTNSSEYSPLQQDELGGILDTIWPDGKNNPLLQLADLMLHPLCHRTTGKENRAYQRIIENKMLIDLSHSDPTIAVKYSCYDGHYGKGLLSFVENTRDS